VKGLKPGPVQSLFVTGTDTGVGKTHVSARLISAWREFGFRIAPMKPIASGAVATADGWQQDDVDALIAASGREWPRHLVNPYCFAPPIAPHLAAALAGESIRFEPIVQAFDWLRAQSDAVVVEGAGGLLIPLNERDLLSDLIVALKLPVLLVVGLRLGCLNHALLTQTALQRAGIPLLGWVGNAIDPHFAERDGNLATLDAWLAAPCWGVLPFEPTS
jgi:dethiobiotin synthetase